MHRHKDITGQKFGSLIAVTYSHSDSRGTAVWTYSCDCGNFHTTRASTITYESKKGDPQVPSCGCIELLRKTKHGFRRSLDTHPTYRAYRSMMSRCYNPNVPTYHRYGGEGVKVCQQWRDDPKSFIEWSIANGWKPDLVIDKDILCKEKGISPCVYSPDTCLWISAKANTRAATSRSNYGRHPNIKLSQTDVEDLLRRYDEGEIKANLARYFGVGFTCVSKIIAKRYEPV